MSTPIMPLSGGRGKEERKGIMKHRAFIKQADSVNVYLVYVPVVDGYTEGDSYEEAKAMAKDLLQNYMKHHTLPEPLSIEECYRKAKENADDIIDYTDGALAQIEVDDGYIG